MGKWINLGVFRGQIFFITPKKIFPTGEKNFFSWGNFLLQLAKFSQQMLKLVNITQKAIKKDAKRCSRPYPGKREKRRKWYILQWSFWEIRTFSDAHVWWYILTTLRRIGTKVATIRANIDNRDTRNSKRVRTRLPAAEILAFVVSTLAWLSVDMYFWSTFITTCLYRAANIAIWF